ncbi:MAG: hypothetical protein JNL01_13950 [Bdellovibrionales bacterium]|nr:hypothetical protein [Bdellovibrionales bacterium]
MRKLAIAVSMFVSFSAFAHDEGHGPKLTDTGRQGGIVAPVVDAKDAAKGAGAQAVFKSELVRSDDGSIRLFLYDKSMNPADLSKFGKTAQGTLLSKKSKKMAKETFSLNQEDGSFFGKAPKAASKPFNIEVRVKEGSKELLTAFENLD